MAEKYRLTVLALARRDIQEQFDYLKLRSPQGAATWYERQQGALDRLKVNPLANAPAPENPHVDEEIRQILFKTPRGLPYRILYTIVTNEIRVLRVRGPGQDLLEQSQLF